MTRVAPVLPEVKDLERDLLELLNLLHRHLDTVLGDGSVVRLVVDD